MSPIFMDDIIQQSDEWFQAKLGKVSASKANQIMTSTGGRSSSRRGYLYILAAEILTGERVESYKSKAMEMGNDREDESRSLYELISGETVTQVGLVYKDSNKDVLCSPDGILTEERGLELKNVLPKTQIQYLLNNKLPTEYVVQVQFSLYVTGFKEWIFFSYCPNLSPLTIKVLPDLEFHKKLAVELELFVEELKQIVTKIGG